MSSNTKTIAFRVSQAIDEQIEAVARHDGLSKGEWVREQAMRTLHALSPSNPDESAQLLAAGDAVSFGAALEARLAEMESGLRLELEAIKKAISQTAKSHHQDLCTMAQVGLTVEESMEQRIDESCGEVLDAIERLKQSQRSHKDTLLRVIGGEQGKKPNRHTQD